MYVCRHCGYVSQESNINYCNNEKCKYFGYAAFIAVKNEKPIEKPYEKSSDYLKGNQKNQEIFDFLPPETRSSIPQYLNSKNDINDSFDFDNPDKHLKEECKPSNNGYGMLGLATVPFQKFDKVYTSDKGLKQGTIFPALDMPYNKKIFKRG